MVRLVLYTHMEVIHHGAEICLFSLDHLVEHHAIVAA
jgi:hypothetical protein